MVKRQVTLEWAQHAGDTNPRFLRNEEYHDYLKVSDCSQVSDGGSGMVLATEDGLRKLGKSPSDCVEVIGWGLSSSPLAGVSDFTALGNTAIAANEAFQSARVSRDDVGVVEVHDCFAVTEWLMLEALGFAKPGEAPALTVSGKTNIDGSLPVNTGGGLIGFGHPVGATGIKQMVEVFRQMKGRCGDYQVPNTPSFGVTANMGGDDRTSVVAVFKNV